MSKHHAANRKPATPPPAQAERAGWKWVALLMLVAAFAGRELILDAYRHAVEREYHFYSYGDAMLIL